MMMNTCKIHRSGRLIALPAHILVPKPNLVNGCIDRAGYQQARHLVAPLDGEGGCVFIALRTSAATSSMIERGCSFVSLRLV